LERVLHATHLRRPQKEALEKVHRIIVHLDRDLPEMEPDELAVKVRELYPHFVFVDNIPQMTVALATGVGKTRLMGAIAAYLYLGRQSENVLLLAPRAAIVRKLVEEVQTGSSKYIFVDPSLVPEPRLWHSGNLDSFMPPSIEPDLFRYGPTVFVLSPQSLTGGDRRAARQSEFSGTSVVDYLSSRRDLVVMVDEAHHLGRVAQQETQAWTLAVRQIKPRLQFGMTATPQEQDRNILHAYDLRTTLREKLYTKDVRIIVRERSEREQISDEDWDHVALDFGLDRLERKDNAIQNYRSAHTFPNVRPVMLVCAEDTTHAELIAAWLKNRRAFDDAEILVTHSARAKREEDVERLVGIDKPGNRIRVVVNVFELTEGWDVSNVYVVAPLRRLGTFQGAVQTMGRGLRLPAGHRVDDEEVDTLDLLCFGRQSLQEILTSALRDFGTSDDDERYVDVQGANADELNRDIAIMDVSIAARRKVQVSLPRIVRQPVEPDLDFDPARVGRLVQQSATEFALGDEDVSRTTETIKYDFNTFRRLVSGRIVAGLSYLSAPLHGQAIDQLVTRFLEALGHVHDQPVGLDWMLVAEVLKEEVDKPYRRKEAIFKVKGNATMVEFGSFMWKVPAVFEAPIPFREISTWAPNLYRLPISGWKRCVHDAAAFDSDGEYRVAWILDHSPDVEWWVRNDPPRLRIPTPIGNYEPDFVATLRINGKEATTIIEVKGGIFWAPDDSDPRLKARSADLWCNAVNGSDAGSFWQHWVVLDSDVRKAINITDLADVRVKTRYTVE